MTKVKRLQDTSFYIDYMSHNINDRIATAKNSQANSLCERTHQATGNTLQIHSTMAPPQGVAQADQVVVAAITDAVYATRCIYHSVLKTTTGGLPLEEI
jgi:hypothetical protein